MTARQHTPGFRHRRHLTVAAALIAGAMALTACSSSGDDTASPSASSSAGGTPAVSDVTLVTHDSFVLSDGVLDKFEAETGYHVKLVAPGDAGTLVNQLVLTKDAPLGDVVFGIDNTFASRAIDAGVLEPYTSTAPAAADAAALAPDDSGSLTAIDSGDVCMNIDTGWFAEHGVTPPVTLDDLTKPEYKDLLVVSNPATSSPGLAFLLTTIDRYGVDGYLGYWAKLQANGVSVAASWSDAYYVDFTQGGGDGSRPIVLSYSSSPPETVPDGGTEPTTAALLDTCYEQVEYAGVLAGAANPDGAKALIDFLLSDDVQNDLPGAMYVFGVSSTATLPPEWKQWAPRPTSASRLDPAEVDAHREEWIAAWTDQVG